MCLMSSNVSSSYLVLAANNYIDVRFFDVIQFPYDQLPNALDTLVTDTIVIPPSTSLTALQLRNDLNEQQLLAGFFPSSSDDRIITSIAHGNHAPQFIASVGARLNSMIQSGPRQQTNF